ncbi:MAG: HK97 family phage prohead protease [Rhizobiales bacterium]|nr:HK97 family phage prohead protease [Hyphomicrobiales bacterium]
MRLSDLERKGAPTGTALDFAFEFKADEEGTAGTVEGYGSVFNLLDLGGDIILPGAFKKSLADWRKRKALPPMLWQHNPDDPIGIWTEIAEDEKGLRVKGELVLEVPQAKAAYELVKRGALKGLSIGYQTVEAEIDRTTGARLLKRVDIWEISIVTFPMMPEAQIADVKTTNINPRELEDNLRDAGLSQRDAKTAVAVLRKQLRRDAGENERPHGDGARDLLMSMRSFAKKLRS